MKQNSFAPQSWQSFVYCSKTWHLKYLDGVAVSPVARGLQAEANALQIRLSESHLAHARCTGVRAARRAAEVLQYQGWG